MLLIAQSGHRVPVVPRRDSARQPIGRNPVFAPSQLIFIAVVSLILYGTFVFAQIIRHRDYFLPLDADGNEEVHAAAPPAKVAVASGFLLIACLVVVVLLAKSIADEPEW